MAIPNTPSVLEHTTPHLARSADSLESALAQFSKLAASYEHSTVSSVLSSEGKGFDEWLARDIQYGALLIGDETSAITSPQSLSETSPMLENETLGGSTVPSLFEYPSTDQILSYSQAFSAQELGLVATEQPALGLTTGKLQQAAAALNIPWSTELEDAVLAQTKKLPTFISITQNESQPLLSSVNKAITVKRGRDTVVEEPEEVLAKRAKNTDAARRSRLKKLVKLEGLEAKVADLETTNHRLNTRIAVLETEKNGFLIKEAEQNARIAQLEAKVMEARLTLKTRSS
ncbi:MAG: hypothetical protein J3Q66DRAFT_409531 [Benniella sp.]|nr:MAG: hypothetical protein J3Q66DRAFT_409531 [Benniella sp.]